MKEDKWVMVKSLFIVILIVVIIFVAIFAISFMEFADAFGKMDT